MGKVIIASSKNKSNQNKKINLKPIITISISVNIVLLVLLGFYIFKDNFRSNDDKIVDEQEKNLVGNYRGDGTHKECTPGIVCKEGWSSNSYIRLNEDGTCYTNMSFFIGTNIDESSCKWYIDDNINRHIVFEFPDLSGLYHTKMGDRAKREGNYEEDGSLVILNAYLRKEQ